MKLVPTTLAFRLSIFNFVLILLFAAAQYYLLSYLWRKGVRELDQRFNWQIANELARELRPALEPRIDVELLQRSVARLLTINPHIDIAISDLQGELLFIGLSREVKISDFGPGKGRIDVEPIRSFLTIDPNRSLPLYGSRMPNDHQGVEDRKVFSAAPVSYAGEEGYLYVLLDSSRDAYYRISMETLYIIRGGVVTGLLTAIVAGLLGTSMMYLITRRFRVMTKVVRKIADGQLDLRVTEHGTDEVAVLGRSINKMADSIIANLRRVAEADSQRKDMLATLSHDLGSPLAAISTHTQLLQDKGVAGAEIHVGVIQRNAQALHRLITDLLDLAKIEAQELQPTFEPVPIAEMITEELIPKLQPLATENRVTIETGFSEDTTLVLADYLLLSRVLSNLLENAIRYNRPNGTVTVSLTVVDSRMCVEISDTGIGISEAEAARIFEKFYRADPARSKQTGGSGLGLWIVSSIVAAHGTTISVHRRAEGGTTFRFSLPIVTGTKVA